jgi:hypothetical protein
MPPPVPFALGRLLRDGAAPLARRPAGDPFTVTLLLGPGHTTPRDAGLPPELLSALESEGLTLTILTEDDADELLTRPPAPLAEETEAGALRISSQPSAKPRTGENAAPPPPSGPATSGDDAPAALPSRPPTSGDDAPAAPATSPSGPLAAEGGPSAASPPPPGPLGADVLLAAGWTAAPQALIVPGVRARAVLLTSEPPPLAHTGWTEGVATLGPVWLGGELPSGTDAAYVPMPVHRREDLVLVHGEEPFGLLAAAELYARRGDDLSFAVSGVRADLELPFPFLGVEPGPQALAHAFASAAVALAPPVRGWRPAALAMLACGQPVIAPDDDAARRALGPDTAILAANPLAAADAAEHLIADWTDRGARVRAGLERVNSGWTATAAALAAALRAL